MYLRTLIFIMFTLLWVGGIANAQPFAYITNKFDDTVSVIDASDNTVIDTVTVGNDPLGVAVTPDGAFVYVANGFDDTVSVIDTSDNTVIDTVAVGICLRVWQ